MTSSRVMILRSCLYNDSSHYEIKPLDIIYPFKNSKAILDSIDAVSRLLSTLLSVTELTKITVPVKDLKGTAFDADIQSIGLTFRSKFNPVEMEQVPWHMMNEPVARKSTISIPLNTRLDATSVLNSFVPEEKKSLTLTRRSKTSSMSRLPNLEHRDNKNLLLLTLSDSMTAKRFAYQLWATRDYAIRSSGLLKGVTSASVDAIRPQVKEGKLARLSRQFRSSLRLPRRSSRRANKSKDAKSLVDSNDRDSSLEQLSKKPTVRHQLDDNELPVITHLASAPHVMKTPSLPHGAAIDSHPQPAHPASISAGEAEVDVDVRQDPLLQFVPWGSVPPTSTHSDSPSKRSSDPRPTPVPPPRTSISATPSAVQSPPSTYALGIKTTLVPQPRVGSAVVAKPMTQPTYDVTEPTQPKSDAYDASKLVLDSVKLDGSDVVHVDAPEVDSPTIDMKSIMGQAKQVAETRPAERLHPQTDPIQVVVNSVVNSKSPLPAATPEPKEPPTTKVRTEPSAVHIIPIDVAVDVTSFATPEKSSTEHQNTVSPSMTTTFKPTTPTSTLRAVPDSRADVFIHTPEFPTPYNQARYSLIKTPHSSPVEDHKDRGLVSTFGPLTPSGDAPSIGAIDIQSSNGDVVEDALAAMEHEAKLTSENPSTNGTSIETIPGKQPVSLSEQPAVKCTPTKPIRTSGIKPPRILTSSTASTEVQRQPVESNSPTDIPSQIPSTVATTIVKNVEKTSISVHPVGSKILPPSQIPHRGPQAPLSDDKHLRNSQLKQPTTHSNQAALANPTRGPQLSSDTRHSQLRFAPTAVLPNTGVIQPSGMRLPSAVTISSAPQVPMVSTNGENGHVIVTKPVNSPGHMQSGIRPPSQVSRVQTPKTNKSPPMIPAPLNGS